MGGTYFVAQLSWEMYPQQLKITFKMKYNRIIFNIVTIFNIVLIIKQT